MKFITKLPIRILSVLLILTFFVPASGWAKSSRKKKQTVIMLPVGKNQTQYSEDNNEIIKKIRNKLKKNFHFLTLGSAKQLKRTSKAPIDDPKLSEALHLMNDSLDNYNAFNTNAKTTIIAMDSVVDYLNNQIKPSSQASELMVSASMTKAWLLFQSRKKEQSKANLKTLLQLSPKANLQLSYYPPAFRKFFNKLKKETNSGTSTIAIKSSPSAVDVYINHVFVGVTPMSLNLPPQKYTVGFSASGRKSVTKTVNLTKSNHKNVSAKLPWGKKSNRKKTNSNVAWNKLSPSKKTVYASQIAGAANADKSVFFNFVQKKNGIIAQATVYDARYSQLMKSISYPKPIVNLKSSHDKIASYFAKKLPNYLKGNSVSYWSKKIDKDMIVDHRIANKGKKPIYKKPVFWAIVVGLAAIATTSAVLLSNSGSSAPKTGGVTVSFDGLN